MRRSEKAQEIENMRFFINDQKLMFGYTPIWKNSKIINKSILMNVQSIFSIHPFLLKEYNLFSQNTEISLEE